MAKCIICNADIDNAQLGRKKQFCSSACRQKHYRLTSQKRNELEVKNVTKLNEVYNFPAKEFLNSLPREAVKLFITSPPYNLRNSTGGFFRAKDRLRSRWHKAALRNGYDGHSDNMPREAYIQWQREVIQLMLDALRPDGAIFYNHKPRVQAGLMETPDDIVRGFPVRQIIIWNRAGGFNFNDGYFCPQYEFIYLICKPEFRLLPGATGKGDVWNISPERNNEHPAPFPVALPKMILESVDMSGCYVVDPFAGSGTVGVAAQQLGIDYKLNDLSELYVNQAKTRLSGPVQKVLGL